MNIKIKGNITDSIADQFLGMIEIHGGEFFGQYNTQEIAGDLSIANPKKGTMESLMPFLESFCFRRNLELTKS